MCRKSDEQSYLESKAMRMRFGGYCIVESTADGESHHGRVHGFGQPKGEVH